MGKVCLLFSCFIPFASAAKPETNGSSQISDYSITYAGWTYHLGSRNRNQDNYIWGVRYKEFEASTMINSFAPIYFHIIKNGNGRNGPILVSGSAASQATAKKTTPFSC